MEQLWHRVSHSLHYKLVYRVDGRIQHHFTPFVRRIRHNWSVFAIRSVSFLRHLLNLRRKNDWMSCRSRCHSHRSSLTVSVEYIRRWWLTYNSIVLQGSKTGECMSGILHTQRGYGNRFWRVAPVNCEFQLQPQSTCMSNESTLIKTQLAAIKRTASFMMSAFALMLRTSVPPQNWASLWL